MFATTAAQHFLVNLNAGHRTVASIVRLLGIEAKSVRNSC
jgi:hypothetical protein